jgi:hypothetical protein
MKLFTKYIAVWSILLILLGLSCSREKNPPRDEIPLIKDTMGYFELAVKDKNVAAMDSLMSDDAAGLGYSAQKILSEIYPDSAASTFYSFGKRSFAYTKDKAAVDCFIMADSTDVGRPVSITLVKSQNKWLIKRFDLE